jgi:hypothetical protein
LLSHKRLTTQDLKFLRFFDPWVKLSKKVSRKVGGWGIELVAHGTAQVAGSRGNYPKECWGQMQSAWL